MVHIPDNYYDLYIFDFDGTVISSHHVMREALAQCCRMEGLDDPPYAEFFSMMGAPLHCILSRLGLGAQVDVYQTFSRANMHRVELIPGIRKVLTDLTARGKRLVLFTGKDRRRTLELLDRFALRSTFEFVVAADDVSEGKPHPEGINRILQRTRVSAHRVLMIGDGLYDIECAWRAGVDAALVSWGAVDTLSHDPVRAPRWLVDDPTQLCDPTALVSMDATP